MSEIRLLCTPGETLALSAEALEGEATVLEIPVLKPIDLTRSHGFDVTEERLAELAGSYDPQIEMATLNFDHAFGGPSLGNCERVWLQDGLLWVRYAELAAEVVEGIRSKRYTRRSSEFVLNHPATGGWYFTGLALLGNARPAVPGLPPVQLLRSQFHVIFGAEPQEEPMAAPAPKPPAETPPAAPPPASSELVQLQATEVERLREGVALVDALRERNNLLEARDALEKLGGSRISPAVRRFAEPLLVRLWGHQDTVKLSVRHEGQNVERDFALRDALLGLLAAIPEFEALGMAPIAGDDEPARDHRNSDEVALHARHKLTPARLAELRAKYQEGN